MRRIAFEVPIEVIADFTEKLTELELENSIIGRNDDDEIEVVVFYERDKTKQVDELEEYLEELKDGLEDEETEQDQDED
ncbi:MAG: hypothetical protein ACT4ON_10355 [Bacteroidota bacterium]